MIVELTIVDQQISSNENLFSKHDMKLTELRFNEQTNFA